MGPDAINRFEASAALQHLRCAKHGEVLQSLETVEMRRIMQRKPVSGADVLEEIEANPHELFPRWMQRHHHEKWG